MSGIAQELDAKLKTLDAKAALSLEELVREAMELAESENGAAHAEHLPADFFARIGREFGSEPFERRPQGDLSGAEAWKWR